MKKTFSFTKDYTEMIKGVAILLMLVHHLFGFPDWYVDEVSYIGLPLRVNTIEYTIGQFGHICVAIFAFITGYGIFFSYKKGGIVKNSFKKGISFLVCYWLVLFGIAIPINLAFGKTDMSLKFIVQNMFTYDRTLVPFAWYVRFYLEMLITLPLFYRMLTKFATVTIPFFMIFSFIASYYMSTATNSNFFIQEMIYFSREYLLWISVALIGLCFARYNLFERLGKIFAYLKKGEIFVCIALMLILIYFRTYKANTFRNIFSYDCAYAPIFIFLACRIIAKLPQILHSFLKIMGKHSMNIWFIHSLFFFRTEELMKYAYAPKFSILIVAWVAVICIILSMALSSVSDFILNRKQIRSKKTEIERTPSKV